MTTAARSQTYASAAFCHLNPSAATAVFRNTSVSKSRWQLHLLLRINVRRGLEKSPIPITILGLPATMICRSPKDSFAVRQSFRPRCCSGLVPSESDPKRTRYVLSNDFFLSKYSSARFLTVSRSLRFFALMASTVAAFVASMAESYCDSAA